MDKPINKRSRTVLLKRPLPVAVLAAVLVHSLLLVLFRHAPLHENNAGKDLPSVKRIDLHDPANRQFARWLHSHDPARMIMPDYQTGFSHLAIQPVRHKTLEDLPRPPYLSIPRTPDVAPIPGKLHTVSTTLPDTTPAWRSSKSAARTIIQLNDRTLPGAEEYLQLFPLPENPGKLRPAVIKIGSTRLHEDLPRLEVLQSSGNEAADDLALKITRKYLSNNVSTPLSGEISFIWQAAGELQL